MVLLKDSDDLDILGVTFDSKLTFDKHFRSVSRAAAQRLGILRKSWRVFQDILLIGRCFWGFVLPVLEYCSAVWCSAADTHLLERVVSGACTILGVTQSTHFVHSTCALCASQGYTRCFDRTSVYLCASPLQNLTVQQDFYFHLSISLVRSG